MFMYYFMIALCIVFIIFLLRVPIMIAKARGIGGGNLTTIAILSWLGILVGITWIVALVFSLVWSTDGGLTALNKLEKLDELKKRGVISSKEYDAAKKQLLK